MVTELGPVDEAERQADLRDLRALVEILRRPGPDRWNAPSSVTIHDPDARWFADAVERALRVLESVS